jgi:hypothetical protein
MVTEMNAAGNRANVGKSPWHLVMRDMYRGLQAVVDVTAFGAKKYSPGGWLQGRGLSYVETYDSALRHAQAWLAGEEADTESGLPHVAHFAWNALALATLSLTRHGVDDRKTQRAEQYRADGIDEIWDELFAAAPQPVQTRYYYRADL